MEFSNLKVEEIKEIPKELKKYFYDEDNVKLKLSNENPEKVYVIEIQDKREIDLEIKEENAKVIFVLEENCDIEINKIAKLKSEEKCNLDFVYVLNKNSKLKAKLVFVSQDGSKGEFFERIFCVGKNCKADLEIKSVAKDKSYLYCEAGSFIDKKAKGSNVNISEKGVLFGKGKIDFFPNLKIENNDVKASHAASTLRISEDDLFYVQSKGIDKVNAKELFLQEFLR